MIYFDNAATTRPKEEILKLYEKINTNLWYNESSASLPGISAKNLLDAVEKQALELLGLKDKQVIFTSSATEANNLAIYGICKKYIYQNKHIITSKIEHPSVLSCFQDLEKLGFRVTYLNVDKNGIVDLDELKSSLSKDTILVSIMWVNNIVGSIQPIKEIIEILKDYPRVKFHSDLVQGIAKIEPDFNLNDLDLMTFTAHKIEGLKNSAALIINKNINLEQITKGGHQQNNKRAGTVDVGSAVCFVKALSLALQDQKANYNHTKVLYDALMNGLKKMSSITINSPSNGIVNIINFSHKRVKGETLMRFLEQKEIYIGFGSACNAKTKDLEPTLMAMYNDETRATNAVRVSLSHNNTLDEINTFLENLKGWK